MFKKLDQLTKVLFLACIFLAACAPTLPNLKSESDVIKLLPKNYPTTIDSTTLPEDSPKIIFKDGKSKIESQIQPEIIAVESARQKFFSDSKLASLIETALKNNQEINMLTQEITIANNEILARKGEYLPKIGLSTTAGEEKRGELTSQAVSDRNHDVPEKLPIYNLGLKMSWEVPIWRKFKNATQAAMLRYMASVEGRNFMVTRLVAEVANTYYELMAYSKQLNIIQTYLDILQEALTLVRLQKQAARVTELAVKRFEAEVLKNRSRQYELKQQVVQTENRLNLLVGRFPQHIDISNTYLLELKPKFIKTGIPSDLLSGRPDVQKAEHLLEASKLDVKLARTRFYPSLSIEANAGYESFNSKHFIEPNSLFYNFAGNLTAPLINRMGIKADYYSANAKQIQALFDYEKTVLTAYTEVVNQLSMIDNMQKNYSLKAKQVAAMEEAVEISNVLFKAARADYVEVLMTRRDALDAQMELAEIKKQQLTAFVNLYQALGGGWRE